MKVAPVPISWRPEFSIYAAEPFLRSVGDECGWLGGFNGSGTMRCILPYTVIRKFIFRLVRFRVETIPVGEGLSVEEERAFLDDVIEYFRSAGEDMIIPASTNTLFRAYPDGAIAAPYGSYILDLGRPEQTLWDGLHQKHRNVIRNAMKQGVQIRTGMEHLQTVHQIIETTLKRSKLHFMSRAALEKFVRGLGENVKLIVAEHQGVAQGCAVVPYSLHSAYYLYAGSITRPVSGAMNLLNWEAIRLFQSLGVKRYDFVGVRINPEKGSKQAGLRLFKERFGGSLNEGYMWKFCFHRLKYWAYCAAVRLRNRGDIVDLERHKLSPAPARGLLSDTV
jgi:hypothetical protein